MNNNNTSFDEHSGFELYFEGIKIPYLASFSITELIGQFPSAEIFLPSTTGIFKILPNTIVQIFGPDPLSKESILLFEGEIKTVAYQKNNQARFVSFQCTSFLQNWSNISAIPADSFITHDYRSVLSGYTKQADVAAGGEAEPQPQVEGQAKEEKIGKTSSNFIDFSFTKKPEKFDMTKYPALTTRFNFADEIARIIALPAIKEGDLHTGIEFFLEAFAKSNIWYGSEAFSKKILYSVFTFPNTRVAAFRQILNETILKSMVNDAKNLAPSGALFLLKGIFQFLDGFEYSFISPAGPTGIFNPYASGEEGKRVPGRMLNLPSLDLAPPINCNIFYPNQVENLSYSRAFEAEPTRSIGSLTFDLKEKRMSEVQGASFFGVYPKLKYSKTQDSEVRANLTLMEWISGLRPNEIPFSNTLVHYVRKYEENFKDGKIVVDPGELKEDIPSPSRISATYESFKDTTLKALQELTEREHIKAKLSKRNLTLTCAWSPYRLVGAPAVYVESEGGPSFTGVIASIKTNFDGSGNIKSNVTFTNCRAIEDVRIYSKEQYTGLIAEFTEDPFVDSAASLFDEKFFSYKNIGKEIYPYLMHGAFNKSTEFSQTRLKGPKAIQNRLSRDVDYSILSTVRDKAGNFVISKTSKFSSESLSNNNSFVYTQLVYEAIYNLKDSYKANFASASEDPEKFNSIINRKLKRRLITKQEYFGYFGIATKNLGNALTNSYKSSKIYVDQEDTVLNALSKLDPLRAIKSDLISETEKTIIEMEDRVKKLTFTLVWDKKNNETYEALTKDTGEWPVDKDGVKAFWPMLPSDIQNQVRVIEELEKKIEKLRETLSTFQAGVISNSGESTETIENALKKLYNITRRNHVNLAISGLLQKQNDEFIILK